MMIKGISLMALIILIGGLVFLGIKALPKEYKYHCHGKNYKLYKSIEPDGNVFLKSTEDCIDIRNIKEIRK